MEFQLYLAPCWVLQVQRGRRCALLSLGGRGDRLHVNSHSCVRRTVGEVCARCRAGGQGRHGDESGWGEGHLAGPQLGGWAGACPWVGCLAFTRGSLASGVCEGSVLGNELGNDQMQLELLLCGLPEKTAEEGPCPPSLWTEHLCCGDHVLRGCGLWSSLPQQSP